MSGRRSQEQDAGKAIIYLALFAALREIFSKSKTLPYLLMLGNNLECISTTRTYLISRQKILLGLDGMTIMLSNATGDASKRSAIFFL